MGKELGLGSPELKASALHMHNLNAHALQLQRVRSCSEGRP
eukprot:SAG11_NODE_389_length_9870_cov_7.646812_2_plen_41_part_00